MGGGEGTGRWDGVRGKWEEGSGMRGRWEGVRGR